eukprot:1157826-Pelagomonas_calceolata.AAC.2
MGEANDWLRLLPLRLRQDRLRPRHRLVAPLLGQSLLRPLSEVRLGKIVTISRKENGLGRSRASFITGQPILAPSLVR